MSARAYISTAALFTSCRRGEVCSLEDALLIRAPLPPCALTVHPDEWAREKRRGRVQHTDSESTRVREKEEKTMELNEKKELAVSFSSWFLRVEYCRKDFSTHGF